MKQLLSNISINVNEKIYIKNPESSDLGRRIIKGGIDLLDEVGFDDFTFNKLAKNIRSTEASIYRYFESKHKFLLFLTSWYWCWMEYQLVFRLANIDCPEDRLERALRLLAEEINEQGSYAHINEYKLHRIVISESSKAYLTREVDQENKEGVFSGYKQLVEMVSNIILEINPEYKYPHMLISTVIEGAHHQRYFAAHLPRLTDEIQGKDAITEFYIEMVFRSIQSGIPDKLPDQVQESLNSDTIKPNPKRRRYSRI
jgi:AcrR family transcriptional regulator